MDQSEYGQSGGGYSNGLNASTPASEDAVRAAERQIGKNLPDDYRAFLLDHNGGEGFIGKHYLILWKAEELNEFNNDYEIGKYAPGFLVFGSDGGGEGFAFDMRTTPYRVVQVPFIGMSLEDGLWVAGSFEDLLKRMREAESLF